MTAIQLSQKTPMEVYDDWQKAIESIRVVIENAQKGVVEALPSWTLNLSLNEIQQLTENIASETDWHFSLALMASIEGLFHSQLKILLKRKRKDRVAKSLRQVFRDQKDQIEQDIYMRFDDILDTWKKVDQTAAIAISKLKDMLQYRHWLAHGRYWPIHYWNCPDPNDVYLLFVELDKAIGFELPGK